MLFLGSEFVRQVGGALLGFVQLTGHLGFSVFQALDNRFQLLDAFRARFDVMPRLFDPSERS
jgi:hypothetical protein